MILLESMGDPAMYWLRYERQEILSGQVWRIFTGHFVHLGWQHLLVNLAGLVLTYFLFSNYLQGRLGLFVFIAITFGVSTGLIIFSPEVVWYVGLSGVLHGILIYSTLIAAFEFRRESKKLFLYIFLAIILLVKISYELLIEPLPTSAVLNSFKIISEAHLYGVVSGVILAVAYLAKPYLIQIKRSTD
jgi:rhomboid family GlyGly-CTERM serine protease